MTDLFPPSHQNIITPKLLELETWHCETMITSPWVSCVTFPLSCTTCNLSPGYRWYISRQPKKNVCFKVFFSLFTKWWISWWTVCYQLGLPCLVLMKLVHLNKINIVDISYFTFLNFKYTRSNMESCFISFIKL